MVATNHPSMPFSQLLIVAISCHGASRSVPVNNTSFGLLEHLPSSWLVPPSARLLSCSPHRLRHRSTPDHSSAISPSVILSTRPVPL
ncbi:uncharacterized protein BO80DRAFT_140176 [Aspergillus ibericus CBS 121593]|uniref:Uncharacterized protein n=1 Tax=Aspergillus ibericus CBS 121593 TaxID=1448316 RepID=A0A395GWU8_9EURO|nr:hypothetical protein BO80DRAFT_140176 [Aspergillus ibericus CBS 121593]RAK99157.1 hypothetical protein BO80DRAFT_140176 [Aspergillus ibericus CBS 121593]